jgi:phage terminase small subunit
VRQVSDVAQYKFARPDLDQVFINEFVASGLDYIKASIACGVDRPHARKFGQAMIGKPHVKAGIKDVLQRKAEAASINIDKVAAEIQRVAFATIGEYLDNDGEVNITSIMRPEAAAVGEVITTSSTDRDGNITRRTKVKLLDKLKALELLGRHLTMFTDKLEVDGLDNLAEALKQARERVESGK